MSPAIQILVVEDNPGDVDLIRAALPAATAGGGFEIESVPRLAAAVARLDRGGVDLLLVDLGLPDSQGLDTLHQLQKAAPDLPVIVLTGNVEQDLAVKAVREGAQDFLIKGQVGGDVLARSVRYALERKLAEERERLARGILELLNRPNGSADVIHDILLLIKKRTGLKAVGIRLRDGDDYPYYATNGFSDSFVQAERFLCERDAAGNLVRGQDGNAVLECMCGNVICGRTDPTKPFFTANGSFWTNGTTKLLATTTEQDRQSRTRNRCNGEGYESVALIPLRSGTETIGLLQLNDHRPDRFRRGMIRFFEGLGSSIGIALARKRAEQIQRDTLTKLRLTFAGVIETVMRAVEIRDPYTAGHQRRVANLARAIGEQLNLSAEQLDAILFAGNIHDIGKIAVPAEILSKPGKLSAIEFGLIKEHSRTAYEMLRPVTFPWPLPEIVLQHHERLDGSGYPDGLAGAAIRPEAQIIAVADVVEAMASHRPYRAALGIDVALAEISRQRGKQLDGPAVDACIHLFRDKAYQFPA
jgi:HD-GYP domain-containing protein (c-di-GMP phosphodiesterase class II)/CheY-like chemotaxis protein